MSTGLKEALWWTVVFVVIATVVATGIRLVDWITEGETDTHLESGSRPHRRVGWGWESSNCDPQIQNGQRARDDGV